MKLIVINWIFAAKKFKVYYKIPSLKENFSDLPLRDITGYDLLFEMSDNQNLKTSINFPQIEVLGLKIILEEVNINLGIYKGKKFFGIRSIELTSSKLDLAIRECSDAKSDIEIRKKSWYFSEVHSESDSISLEEPRSKLMSQYENFIFELSHTIMNNSVLNQLKIQISEIVRFIKINKKLNLNHRQIK